jgi:hypothetical protein
MTIARGFTIILLSGFAFALGGGLFGYALAAALPSYYRGTSPSGDQPWFNAIEVGIGLGLSQGLICGLFLGAIIVLAVAWYSSRRSSLDVSLTANQRQEVQRSLSNPPANSGEIIPREQIKAEALARFGK